MNDVATVFAKNPLKLSDADIALAVETFRQARSRFALTGKAPAKTTAKEAAVKKSVNIDLDLGF